MDANFRTLLQFLVSVSPYTRPIRDLAARMPQLHKYTLNTHVGDLNEQVKELLLLAEKLPEQLEMISKRAKLPLSIKYQPLNYIKRNCNIKLENKDSQDTIVLLNFVSR
jgi:hypothetical protein